MSTARAHSSSSARPPHPLWLPLTLVLMVLAGLGMLAGSRPPAALPADAPPAAFAAGRALALTATLAGDETPHPLGSAANAAVGARVAAAFAELGGPVETQQSLGCQPRWAVCGEVTNLMTRLPGVTEGPAVLLTAHYDSVGAGPGIADDLSSVAAIIEIGRILAVAGPARNPVILLASDGEEPGLLGAEAFIADHPWAATVGMVVNLEAGGTSGPSLLLQSSSPNGWLVDTFRQEAPRPVGNSFYDALFDFLPNNTDFTVYTSHGISGVNLAFAEGSALYHTPRDALAYLNPDSLQHQGENALALTRALAARDPAIPPGDDQVFVDLLPGLIVAWPAALSGWVGLAALGVLLATAAWLWRRGELRLAGLAWGLLPLPVGAVLAGGVAYGWALAMIALDGGNLAWFAATGWMRVAVWLLAALLVLGPAGLVARRAGVWGPALGAWLWLALFAALTGWLAPGFSILFIPLAWFAAILLLAAAVITHRGGAAAPPAAAALAAIGAGTVFLPLAVGTEDTTGGADLIALIAVSIALGAATLVPLAGGLAALPRWRWLATGGAGLIVVAASVALLISPAYSLLRPQRLNLLHVEQAATGQAEWAWQNQMPPEAPGVPASLRDTAAFGAAPASLPWQSSAVYRAPAPPSGAAPPAAALGTDAWRDGTRETTITLRTGRDSARLALYVPVTAGLQHVTVAGWATPLAPPPAEGGFHVIRCVGSACDGFTLTLGTAGAEPVTLDLVAASPTLPPAAADLLAARPESAVPSHDGDQALLVTTLTLPALPNAE